MHFCYSALTFTITNKIVKIIPKDLSAVKLDTNARYNHLRKKHKQKSNRFSASSQTIFIFPELASKWHIVLILYTNTYLILKISSYDITKFKLRLLNNIFSYYVIDLIYCRCISHNHLLLIDYSLQSFAFSYNRLISC
jgi:hypothetical protein